MDRRARAALAVLVAVYVAFSLMYTFMLKHIPVVELAFVAAGFGAARARRRVRDPGDIYLVPGVQPGARRSPSPRTTELALLGPDAAIHRPVMLDAPRCCG